MRFPPPIVAQTDPSRLAGFKVEPLELGMVPWPERELTTIVVKVAYTYRPGPTDQTLELSPKQPPLTHDDVPASAQGAVDGELDAPSDFVAAKVGADVLLSGRCYTATPSEKIDARIRIVDRIERAFCAVGTKNDSSPLTGGYLREPDGTTPTAPVGPMVPREVKRPPIPVIEDPAAAEAQRSQELMDRMASGDIDPTKPLDEQLAETPAQGDDDEDIDTSHISDEDVEIIWSDLTPDEHPLLDEGVQHAAAASTAKLFLEGDEVIELDGLAPGGHRRVLRLAGHEPQVIYETGDVKLWPVMVCDTIAIDTVAHTVTLTWRGQVTVEALSSPTDRIVLALTPLVGRPLLTHVYRDLQRGHFARARLEGEQETVGLQTDRDHELELARYATFDRTPEPVLDMNEYATVAAELAATDDRKAVLARHHLSEDDWLLEERGWLDRVAQAMSKGDLMFPMTFNAALARARAKVAGGS